MEPLDFSNGMPGTHLVRSRASSEWPVVWGARTGAQCGAPCVSVMRAILGRKLMDEGEAEGRLQTAETGFERMSFSASDGKEKGRKEEEVREKELEFFVEWTNFWQWGCVDREKDREPRELFPE